MPDINLLDSLPAAPAPAESPAPAAEEGGGIPDEVLQLPEMAGLLRGTPPAIWSEHGVKTPETEVIVKHQNELANAGFGFYNSPDKKTNVIFNTQFTSLPEIQAMDKAGKLREFATPLADVTAAFSGAGAPPAEGQSAPPQAIAPANPSMDAKLATQRVNNLGPGDPTSGPLPGQGRILNSILKPTV